MQTATGNGRRRAGPSSPCATDRPTSPHWLPCPACGAEAPFDGRRVTCQPCDLTAGPEAYSALHRLAARAALLEAELTRSPMARRAYEAERAQRIAVFGQGGAADLARSVEALRALVVKLARGERLP